MAYQFENVKLDKGMYRNAGMSFSQVLEKADPSQQYKGTELEGLDAFQRQLKRFDIKVKGPDSDCVEKFFRTADSAILFPEYISRCVHQGMTEADILPNIVSTVTKIDSMDYRSIKVEAGENGAVSLLEEGTEIPATTIVASSNLVSLKKRGRMLVASYEAIRHQKLDLFSITLRQLGVSIARAQLEDAVEMMLQNSGSVETETEGQLTYGDLVNLWSYFDPYQMNTLLVSYDMMTEVLKLPELQNTHAGFDFQSSGKLVTPMGATMMRCSAVPEGTIIALDKRYAMEMVESGGVIVEYDKLIDRQLERAAITATAGFAPMFNGAIWKLER